MLKHSFKKLLTFGLVATFAVIVFAPMTSRAQLTDQSGLPVNTTTVPGSNTIPGLAANGSVTSSTNNSGINALLNLDPSAAAAGYIAIAGLNAVLYFVLTVVQAFLAFSGILLDWAISFSVTNFAQNIYTLTGINTAWQLIRDLANMSFIFILVYEGIRLMFGKGPGKKVVVSVVIAALLINFSLFFTKIIIDASNVVTVSFYNNILNAVNATPIQIFGTGLTINPGLSYAIMQSTGINTLNNPNTALAAPSTAETISAAAATSATAAAATTLGPLGYVGARAVATVVNNPNATSLSYSAQLLFSTIFALIAAFVFFAMVVLFLVRYLYFIFLLILSPVAYLAGVVPGLKKTRDQYWSTLLSQCYFAPVFMLMIWITLQISANLTQTTGAGSLSDMFNQPGTSVAGGLMNYLMIIGMLIFTMITATSFAKKGAFGSAKVIDTGMGWMGGAVFGTTGALGRNTIGRWASNGQNADELQKRADNGDYGAKARLGLMKGSYDPRRSTAGESLQKTTNVNFGKGIPFNDKFGQGGFAGKKADKKKTNEAELDSVMKKYSDKRDWAGLAEALVNRSENDQKYMYKKVPNRDRVFLDKALADPALTEKLRGTLPMDDQITWYSTNKDWTGLSTFLRSKPSPQEQEYIYEKLSPRDRAAFDTTLGDPILTGRLRSALSLEELEKTEKAQREAQKEAFAKQKLTDIRTLVASRTGTPAQYDALFPPSGRDMFPVKMARELNDDALNDPKVIERLSPKHLADIIANSDSLDQAAQDNIVLWVTGVGPGTLATPVPPPNPAWSPIRKQQYKYMTSGTTAQLWGVL